MRGDIFKPENMAQQPTEVGMSLQSPYCVKYVVNGEVLAKQGSMIAYRGNLQIETKSQGVGNFLKRAVTGEGIALMNVRGQGEIWFAEYATSVFIMELDPGDALAINGRNVLVFDPSLQYQISMVKSAGGFVGGGLFNCVFTGQGRIAVTADGPPLVIPVTPNLPVFVDTNAIIGWSANLQPSIFRSQGMKSILKGGSGEMFQMQFQGQGFVVVQPSEGPIVPAAGGSGGGGGGLLGGLGG